MRDRKGDWRDLLASHSLAVDTKKLWLGFVATLATVALLTIMAGVQGALVETESIAKLGIFQGRTSFMSRIIQGEGLASLWKLLPLFNPLAAGLAHFAISMLFYIVLLAVWSYCGGAITRLAALQYARDDIPTLGDAVEMVRAKRNAFWFAPITPLFGVIIFAVCNMVIGLIGSIPYVGGWVTAVCLPFVSLPAALIATFIIVLGVATFGLMFPAISIGGKDAFEGWSSAYSYLLWGFNRFVGYTVVAAVVGVLTVLLASGVAELFIWIMVKTVSIGLIGKELLVGFHMYGSLQALYGGALGLGVASWVMVLVALLARALVVAYAFSYFFTANTIICFLLRKHVDRIEVDEVYEETAEEELEEEAFEEPVPEPEPVEPTPAETEEEPEEAEVEEAAEEEPAEEEAAAEETEEEEPSSEEPTEEAEVEEEDEPREQ